MKIQNNMTKNEIDQDANLSFWSILKNQQSTVYDYLSCINVSSLNELSSNEYGDLIFKPHIKFNNLNKSTDDLFSDCVKPKTAIEIGFTIEF